MPRTEYRNGDPIDLLCGCNDCSPTTINGVLCHEAGCPSAWKDTEPECGLCGCPFTLDHCWQKVCSACQRINS